MFLPLLDWFGKIFGCQVQLACTCGSEQEIKGGQAAHGTRRKSNQGNSLMINLLRSFFGILAGCQVQLACTCGSERKFKGGQAAHGTRRLLYRRIFVASTVLAVFAHQNALRADEGPAALKPYRKQVDRAVDSALVFLARSQAAHPAKDGAYSDWNGETNAVVGLTGMAFLARGYRPGAPPYGNTINSTIDYILSTPTKNGYLGVRGGKMYGHGIATLYLSEVSGMVDAERQERIDAMLGPALKVILDAQKVAKQKPEESGGWRYEPDSHDSDLSVSGWCLMALRSARLNGAPVPKEAIADAIAFVDRCRHNEEKGFRYTPTADWWYGRRGYWVRNPSSPAMSAAGLLSRELSGFHGDDINREAADYLIKNLLPGQLYPEGNRAYAVYYASQALYQVGGTHWEKFAEEMYKYLLAKQRTNGAWFEKDQGEIYPTAMYTLALSVDFGQLPIYQR
jgi:hypothetical protein